MVLFFCLVLSFRSFAYCTLTHTPPPAHTSTRTQHTQQGSTSSVWAPKSFLHHAAPGHTGVLPLYPPQAGGTSPIGSGGSGGGGQGPRRTVSMGPPSASGGSGSSLARYGDDVGGELYMMMMMLVVVGCVHDDGEGRCT